MRRTFCMMAMLLMAAPCMTGPAGGLGRAAIQETETNDNFASANPITLNNSYYGDVGYRVGDLRDSADFFSFDLLKDQPFSVNVSVVSSQSGMQAFVYDPAQQETNSSASLSGGQSWECNRTAGNSPGTWYLKLTGSQSNYTFDTWTKPPCVDPVPKISIKTPANNSVAPGLLVDVRGNASDDKAVASVHVYPDGTPQQNWTRATGTTDWSATVNMSEQAAHGGNITIRARVTDTDGYTNNTTVTVCYQNHMPRVSLTSPVNNTEVPGLIVRMEGTASDDKSVHEVSVFPEGATPANWTKATGTTQWSADLNISDYAKRGGTIGLCAVASDGDGNMNGTSVTVLYYNFSPRITITGPANNSVVSSLLVEVSGTASDDKGVRQVDVFPEGATPAYWTSATGTTTWSATVNISGYAAHGGGIRLWAVAGDDDDNMNETSITVHYQGFSPIVTITSPRNNSNVTDTLVVVSGTASDDEAVERVDVAPEGAGPAGRVRATGTTRWTATVNISGSLGPGGAVTIWAFVSDNDGNTNSTAVTVHYNASPPADTTAPAISITSPQGDLVLTDLNVRVEGTVEDEGGVSLVMARVDQQDWRNVSLPPAVGPRIIWNVTLTLHYGLCVLAARAVDRSGNAAECSTTVIVVPPDTTAPEIVITYPSQHPPIPDSTVVIRGTAVDNIGVAKVEAQEANLQTPWKMATTVDGWRNWTITFPLNKGINHITVRATDLSGNTADAQIEVFCNKRDTEKPTIHIVFPQNGSSTDRTYLTVRGNVSDNFGISRISLVVNREHPRQINCYCMNGSANWTADITLKEGANAINVTAQDYDSNLAHDEVIVICTSTKRPFLPGFELTSAASVLLSALAILTWRRRR